LCMSAKKQHVMNYWGFVRSMWKSNMLHDLGD
jgi:hypothetical protein